ncbi:hypothetical protein LCGC14_2502140 [marine sediment metagenome]|uniref:Uncharacterized protein n=1 Tax=marine sediment metagenome TaxID=412755 RepID=A0A0F9DDD1_9ZZZZ
MKTKNSDWNYLDTTHPDAIYLSWDSPRNKGEFVGGKNLSDRQKSEYHKVWVDRLNKELKEIRGIMVTDKGVQWANKAAQKGKTEQVAKLIAQRNLHKKVIRKGKRNENQRSK